MFYHIDGVSGLETGLPALNTINVDTLQREIANADPQQEPVKRILEALVDLMDHRFAVAGDVHFAGSQPCPGQT